MGAIQRQASDRCCGRGTTIVRNRTAARPHTSPRTASVRTHPITGSHWRCSIEAGRGGRIPLDGENFPCRLPAQRVWLLRLWRARNQRRRMEAGSRVTSPVRGVGASPAMPSRTLRCRIRGRRGTPRRRGPARRRSLLARRPPRRSDGCSRQQASPISSAAMSTCPSITIRMSTPRSLRRPIRERTRGAQPVPSARRRHHRHPFATAFRFVFVHTDHSTVAQQW